ncbi:hypothetical protein ACFQ45_17505 [Rhodanobacter aciditrophus]|uniref:Uncharacterized protein n=1 Tax=Rhodanobacter aciditrophus TaxID=1623218 RepID=A0ABW4B921_9GAMM
MKVQRINWPLKVPEKLLTACGDDFKTIRNQVQDGIAHLYKLESDNTDLLVVTRGEETPSGREFVIVCVAGHGMKDAGQFLIDNASRLGFDSIRYHANEATHRLYSAYGFGGDEIERVYKVALGGE